MTEPITIFMLGKGGTGKSTASALLALELCERQKKVLLASFDDAHNLSDIFDRHLSDKPVKINPNLHVIQVDRQKEIRRYLEQTTRKVKQSYTYLTAFNLDHYFDVLKYSPGMEAHALAGALMDLKKQYQKLDMLIIDMPPTALSLHFFNLPSLSLLWVEQLEKMRLDINQRKEIISRIKFAGKEIDRDKVLSRIRKIKSDHQILKDFFQDPGRSIFLAIHNGDRLSVAETGRIIEQLSLLSIDINGLVHNHRIPADLVTDSPVPWTGIPSRQLPYSSVPLVGMPALTGYGNSYPKQLSGLLDHLEP